METHWRDEKRQEEEMWMMREMGNLTERRDRHTRAEKGKEGQEGEDGDSLERYMDNLVER
eukprot:1315618-Amorphochlora_amoeboformis.AAC.1